MKRRSKLLKARYKQKKIGEDINDRKSEMRLGLHIHN